MSVLVAMMERAWWDWVPGVSLWRALSHGGAGVRGEVGGGLGDEFDEAIEEEFHNEGLLNC